MKFAAAAADSQLAGAGHQLAAAHPACLERFEKILRFVAHRFLLWLLPHQLSQLILIRERPRGFLVSDQAAQQAASEHPPDRVDFRSRRRRSRQSGVWRCPRPTSKEPVRKRRCRSDRHASENRWPSNSPTAPRPRASSNSSLSTKPVERIEASSSIAPMPTKRRVNSTPSSNTSATPRCSSKTLAVLGRVGQERQRQHIGGRVGFFGKAVDDVEWRGHVAARHAAEQ